MSLEDKPVVDRQVAAEDAGSFKVAEAPVKGGRAEGSGPAVPALLLPHGGPGVPDGAAQQVRPLGVGVR